MSAERITRVDVSVRAYTEALDKPDVDRRFYENVAPATGWSLIFDTETTIDYRLALRFGCYQLRQGPDLREHGLFYDPDEVSKTELATLTKFASERGMKLEPVGKFLAEVFVGFAYEVGAAYIGLNLPFDLSRLAIGHTGCSPSRKSFAMVGGFTFRYSEDDRKPKIQVKHLNSRCALIRFTIPRRPQETPGGMRRRGVFAADRRGHFIDLRSLASALLSGSWSLARLGEFLETEHQKIETDEHGKITPEYLEYACQDVQVTWECYVKLAEQYKRLGLRTATERIISEASLGKAYLDEIGIKPWSVQQPDFPRHLLGAAMASYYGGRAEVHARRVVVPVVYCDFLSMYPTVCVLMRLWNFVRSQGMSFEQKTDWAKAFLESVTVYTMQQPENWHKLTALVRVLPDGDMFPVRAKYDGANRSIGLNLLTSDKPMWFTMADCVASKLLTGKPPVVLEAVAFRPKPSQEGLRPVSIGGNPENLIDPSTDDFFKSAIELRQSIKGKMKNAGPEERARLETEQQQLKICVNATSYGIFVELNPNTHGTPVKQHCYGGHAQPFDVSTTTVEEPGRFFNPILGTLITGAARLMLALCETVAGKHGLTWAFCDTDGIALTPQDPGEGCSLDESVETVREWFRELSPYDGKPHILKLEDDNYRISEGSLTNERERLYLFAVSSKRYALFNEAEDGQPIIRKASAHGLGHLVAPYEDSDAPDWIPAPVVSMNKLGVRRWQHDLWYLILLAAKSAWPECVEFSRIPAFSKPAVSQYAATSPELVDWFGKFNVGKEYRKTVRPFGFMLSCQARRDLPTDEMPRASAPYDRDPLKALARVFDRVTGEPIPREKLRSVGEAISQYHLHPESKFLRADYLDTGFTLRRHVHVLGVEHIGKESNRWEESVAVGELMVAELSYGECPEQYRERLAALVAHVSPTSRRRLAHVSKVSASEIQRIAKGAVQPGPETIAKLMEGLEQIRRYDLRRKASSPNSSQPGEQSSA